MIIVGIIIGIIMLISAAGFVFIASNNSPGVNTPDLDDEREMIRHWQEEIDKKNKKC